MPQMSTAGDSFLERRERLRQAFLTQLPLRLAAARDELDALDTLRDDAGALTRLELTLHTLMGSSGTFGLVAVHDLVAEADALAKRAQRGVEPLDDALIARLRALFDRLQGMDPGQPGADAPGHFGFGPLPAAVGPPTAPCPPAAAPGPSADQAPRPLLASTAPPTPVTQAAQRERRVYICDDDGELGAQLAAQLGCFGYSTRAFASLEALRMAVHATAPDAVVMDVMFPEGAHAGPAALSALKTEVGAAIPSVYISCRDDFDARLWAVKAGGSAFCTKPVRTTELVELLDTLTNHDAPSPFQILVVDDDPEVSALHALILEAAGMHTAVVNRPAEVLDVLQGFNADLVLMDMYMPDCSGPELARVLRQVPGHLGLPIIYLSSETDRDRQLQAQGVDADGFMTKPADPVRLVTEVTLRAERMRTLRALMLRDGLTGLFNHNAIQQFLEIGVGNARREHRPLSVAMIDVDRFKLVNDTWGHPAGDQVLMALSRGLRLRLRECDVVGRYGGEEFCAVLPGADEATACALIEQLRVSFGGVLFYAGEQGFRCTFSAGVAALPQFATADALIQAADQALYRAKHGGRDRVEVASGADAPGGSR